MIEISQKDTEVLEAKIVEYKKWRETIYENYRDKNFFCFPSMNWKNDDIEAFFIFGNEIKEICKDLGFTENETREVLRKYEVAELT